VWFGATESLPEEDKGDSDLTWHVRGLMELYNWLMPHGLYLNPDELMAIRSADAWNW
jgi:hypothetical protein